MAHHLKHALVSSKAEAHAVIEEALHAIRQVALLYTLDLAGLLLRQSGLSRQACSACAPSQRAAGQLSHTTCAGSLQLQVQVSAAAAVFSNPRRHKMSLHSQTWIVMMEVLSCFA